MGIIVVALYYTHGGDKGRRERKKNENDPAVQTVHNNVQEASGEILFFVELDMESNSSSFYLTSSSLSFFQLVQ